MLHRTHQVWVHCLKPEEQGMVEEDALQLKKAFDNYSDSSSELHNLRGSAYISSQNSN